MLAIMRKEIKSYFYAPVAYILIGLFILLSSVFFTYNLFMQDPNFHENLETMKFLLIFVVPILTMRIIAEDRKNKTEVLLITSPQSLMSIVLGKFLAAYVVFLVMTAITFIYPIIMVFFGGRVTAQLVGAYIGFILLGAAFISIGVFASSLTENQMIAAIVSFVILLIIWLIEPLGYMFGGILSMILNWISLTSRYGDFAQGLLKVSSIVYYISFAAVFVFLTVRVMEKRRWS